MRFFPLAFLFTPVFLSLGFVTTVKAENTGCINADAVFIIGDVKAARAVEVVINSLSFYQTKNCPSTTFRVAVIDALSPTPKVLRPLSPVSVLSVKDAFLLPAQPRPRYRSQWKAAFEQAIEILRKARVIQNKQYIFYLGGIAQDATVRHAKDFLEKDLFPYLYLQTRLREHSIPIWVINGEQNPAFLAEVLPLWRAAYRNGLLEGGLLPIQGEIQTPQEYARALIDKLYDLGVGWHIQEIGCGEYQLPVISSFFIAWQRLKDDAAQWPTVTFEWSAQSVPSKESHAPVFFLAKPPAGIIRVQSSECEALIGFVQVERPYLRVQGPEKVFQDRGQEDISTYRLEALLVDKEGNALEMVPPLPYLEAKIYNKQGELLVTLPFTWERRHLYSAPLPHKAPGEYRWEVAGFLPYSGIKVGVLGFEGRWELEVQKGTYTVIPVELITLHVEVQGLQPNGALALHGEIWDRLPVLPVVVRAWVTDETGKQRSPEELFEDPNHALRVELMAEKYGKKEEMWLQVFGNAWRGEIGRYLPWEGTYRIYVYKGELSRPTLVWDTTEPWSHELVRQDTLFRKPTTWMGVGLTLFAIMASVIARYVWLRTNPLTGSLSVFVEGLQKPLLEISLKDYKRRYIRLDPSSISEAGIGVPVLYVQNRRPGVRIRIPKGPSFDLLPNGEKKPLGNGLYIVYKMEEGDA